MLFDANEQCLSESSINLFRLISIQHSPIKLHDKLVDLDPHFLQKMFCLLLIEYGSLAKCLKSHLNREKRVKISFVQMF